jgi:P27 family predicted phage terminase small subunit
MKPRRPRSPQHLTAEARRFWRQVVDEYQLEAHHLRILETGCEALDRMRQAQALIASEGMTVDGRFGPKQHPAVAVERDSRIALLRAIRELGLDVEAPAQSRGVSNGR